MQVSAQILKDEPRSLGQPHGLTADEAALRLTQFGPNNPTLKHTRPPWLDLLILLTNPLSLILLIAAGISAAIGQRIDAYLIAGMVLIGTGIDFLQTYRSRNIIERLRATVASTALVRRAGAARRQGGCEPWRLKVVVGWMGGAAIRFAASDTMTGANRLV